ncbi:hypothetical protein [Absidia glauca]|uniref:Uncharacterized protein n=1 Tax=Absidia glauca TaxID=4829 RepID=A0A163JJE4_ABSGL|nr:hypothetical protein [Absidia glauca]
MKGCNHRENNTPTLDAAGASAMAIDEDTVEIDYPMEDETNESASLGESEPIHDIDHVISNFDADEPLDLSDTNESDSESNENQDDEDTLTYLGHRMESLGSHSIDPSELASADIERLMGRSGTYPFPNIQSMVLHALVNGDHDMLLERMIKKILYAITAILEVKAHSGDQFELPKLDAIINFQQRKSNSVPSFPTKKMNVVAVDKKGNRKEREVELNLPSDHIRLFVANPKKSKMLSPLPDHTPGELVHSRQGLKWKHHPMFAPPMIVHGSLDFWIGDVVKAIDKPGSFVLSEFFTMSGKTKAKAFSFQSDCGTFLFEQAPIELSVDSLLQHSHQYNFAMDNCFTVTENNTRSALSKLHESLLFSNSANRKRPVLDPNGSILGYYPVKIVPISFFTDDTSANISKQYNKLDGWSMYFAGMPFSERSKTENVCYVSAVLGSSGLNAMDLVPALVDDLLSLERGVLMYCADQGRMVLVIAPILFISADNPRHAEFCSIKMPSSNYPCRKCYYRKKKAASTLDEAGVVSRIIEDRSYPYHRAQHMIWKEREEEKRNKRAFMQI